MKILHVFDHSVPLQSGYASRSRNILENQRKLGWTTEQITSPKHMISSGSNLDEEMIDGLHFYRTQVLDSGVWSLPIINQWGAVKATKSRITELIDKIRPDIIHAHSPVLNGLAALRVGRNKNIPVVYEIRAFWEDAAVDQGTSREGGLRYKLTQVLETKIIKDVDAVFTICDGLRKEIIKRGVPESKVTVVPNSIDSSRFTFNAPVNTQLQQKLRLNGKRVIGFIGSFFSFEGVPALVEVMPLLLKQNPDYRLLLVGGGEDEEKIIRLVRDMGLQDKVVLIGRVPHSEVKDYYSLADLFVYPRLSIRLTELVTPLKPLEAMAQGKLVVASDVGGHKEMIFPGKNGDLFSAGSIDDMVRVIAKTFESEYDWENRKQAGRVYVEHERNWITTVKKYESVYRCLSKGN